MKNTLSFNYNAEYEVSDLSLEMGTGKDSEVKMYYTFYTEIVYSNNTVTILASTLMHFAELKPPSKNIFPSADIKKWSFQKKDDPSYDYQDSHFMDDDELPDLEREVMVKAVNEVCNNKEKVKEVYQKFWQNYIDQKKSAARLISMSAETLQVKLNAFLSSMG